MHPSEKADVIRKLKKVRANLNRGILALELSKFTGEEEEGLYFSSYISKALDQLETITLEYI